MAFTDERGARCIGRSFIISCNAIRSSVLVAHRRRRRDGRASEFRVSGRDVSRARSPVAVFMLNFFSLRRGTRAGQSGSICRLCKSVENDCYRGSNANKTSFPRIEIGILNGNGTSRAYSLTLPRRRDRYSSVTTAMLYSRRT